MSASICRAAAVMSSSSNVTPSDLASRVAYALVVSPVAKPGIVNAWMSERGRPSRSMALAATISGVGRVEATADADDHLGSACPPMACSRCSSPETWML